MANSTQLKSLLQSHSDGNDERFYAVALQVAAAEARKGHQRLADDLRKLVDQARQETAIRPQISGGIVSVAQPQGDVAQLVEQVTATVKLSDLVLEDSLAKRVQRVLREQKNLSLLKENDLRPRQRLLFTGPPGCGKTITASALAGELGLPLFVIRLDSLISRFLGESLSKLRLIFEAIESTRAVYLFDEFDSIGYTRDAGGEVAEMRRVLNSFLVFIEQLQGNSLIIAASNYGEKLDKALFRRFDDLIEFGLPDPAQVRKVIKRLLRNFDKERLLWKKIDQAAAELSYSEVTRACEEVIKDLLINEHEQITNAALITALAERRVHLNH
ncbi:MAG: AAA family ATPase [Roseibacillus sp.]